MGLDAVTLTRWLDARSFLGRLAEVVQHNVTTLIWAGDAGHFLLVHPPLLLLTRPTDWICNYEGGLQAVDALDWHGKDKFSATAVQNYTVDGTVRGNYKTLDNLSWFRVFEAGHEVPYYREF